jgi:hypothetical protein
MVEVNGELSPDTIIQPETERRSAPAFQPATTLDDARAVLERLGVIK